MFNLMNRNDFEELWKAHKSIVDEVQFVASKHCDGVYEFERLQVLTPFPSDVLVHGSYSCWTGAVSFTFWIEGLGPIIRYCMGGPAHSDAGRYHRHLMRNPEDIRQNLPYAEPRPDMSGWSAKQIWDQVCLEGNITHTETFYEPEYLCK
jgi:hypothetical protein